MQCDDTGSSGLSQGSGAAARRCLGLLDDIEAAAAGASRAALRSTGAEGAVRARPQQQCAADAEAAARALLEVKWLCHGVSGLACSPSWRCTCLP